MEKIFENVKKDIKGMFPGEDIKVKMTLGGDIILDLRKTDFENEIIYELETAGVGLHKTSKYCYKLSLSGFDY